MWQANMEAISLLGFSLGETFSVFGYEKIEFFFLRGDIYNFGGSATGQRNVGGT